MIFCYTYLCIIGCQIYLICMNIIQIKTNKKIAHMSCTAYIVYTFHLQSTYIYIMPILANLKQNTFLEGVRSKKIRKKPEPLKISGFCMGFLDKKLREIVPGLLIFRWGAKYWQITCRVKKGLEGGRKNGVKLYFFPKWLQIY